MKIYITARYSRFEEMQGYAADIQAVGHEVTSRWIRGGHSVAEELQGPEADKLRAHFAHEDFDDIIVADAVVSFTEIPRGDSRGGRHVEFGMGVALYKHTVIIGPREHVFHHLPAVEVYPDFETFLYALRKDVWPATLF